MNVIVKGLMTHYQISGRGPVILLLHGWGTNLNSFDDLSQKLGSKYKLVRVDLPGFGASQAPTGSWSLDDYIEFTEAFLKKIKITKLYGLIGHSFGGRIALKAVGIKRLQPTKLVLLAAHGIRESRSLRNRLFWLAAKTGKIASRPLPARHRQALQRKLYRKADTSDYLQARVMRQTFSNIISEDVRPEAAMITCPTLLIYAQNDTVTPPKYGRAFMDLIPGSKLEVVAEGGHFVHQEHPEWVAGIVRTFLK